MKRKKNKIRQLRGRLNKLLLAVVILGVAQLLWQKIGVSSGTTLSGSDPKKANLVTKGKVYSQALSLTNATTGVLVAHEHDREQIYPASLTKIMTTYVALQALDNLSQLVTIPPAIFDFLIKEEATMAGFQANERVPAGDVLYGVMLPSGAEAAIAIARHLAGSEAGFVELMNQSAKELGMSNTHFSNVTGLHDPQHYSTTADISKLLLVALKDADFYAIFTAKSHLYNSPSNSLLLTSLLFNQLTEPQLANGEIIGGKTGYTKEAGQCLASMAVINEETYVLVTAGAKGKPMKEQRHIEDALTIYQSLN